MARLDAYLYLCGKQKIMDRQSFLDLAKERIERLDISAAIEDTIHFVPDQEAIKRTWSKEFFHHWIDKALTD